MMARRWLWLGCGVLVLVGLSRAVEAQENGCVTCHLEAAVSTERVASERTHLDDWERSMHARVNVSCDACHGGDPDASNLASAHQEILSSANPASPVHPSNIPSTCGSCHTGQLDAFRTSRHFELLTSADRNAPSCTACHGSVASRLPSTRGINSTCATCHGPDGVAPISEHQELVRLMRERIEEHRYSLALVRTVIEYTSDQDRRADLERRHDEAEAPLADAVEAWHAFAFERAATPLANAGERIRALIDDLTPR